MHAVAAGAALQGLTCIWLKQAGASWSRTCSSSLNSHCACACRVDGHTYDDAVQLVRSRRWADMLPRDQLRAQLAEGRVFHGLVEGPISFPPTYKFEKVGGA